MAEIVTPDEIKAVSDLTNEFNKLGETLDGIIVKGKENQTTINQSRSVKELTTKIDGLEKEEKKLTDTNKKLNDQQKKTSDSTKGQAEAMSALDNRMGGVINRAKQMGKEFLALMKNPFIAMVAILVVTFAALTSAVKTFLTTTGDGEDLLNRQKAVWNQFFSTLKKGWKDLGKSTVEALGEDGLQGLLFAVLSYFSPAMAAMFLKTSNEAKKLSDVVDDIETRMSINIIKRAETERDYNKLSLAAEEMKLKNQVEAVKLLELGIKKKEEQMRIDMLLAKQNADAVLYQIGLDHSLTKEQVDRMSFKERDAEFTGEEMKKIAEAYADVINLEGKFEQEVKRNTAKIIAYKEQIRKSIVDAAMDGATAEINAVNNRMNAEIAAVKENLAANFEAQRTNEDGVFAYRKAAIEESEKQIREIRRRYADDLVRKQVETLEKILLVEELNSEERAAVEQKLVDFKTKLYDSFYESIVEQNEINLEDIKNAYDDLLSGVGNLFNTFTDNRIAALDREQEAVEKRYDKEIELAGENKEAKEILEKKFAAEQEKIERKRIQAVRRAALFEKATSAAGAVIATALAVTKLLDKPPLAIAAAIAGAAQVTAILAKDIPQYEKGGTTIAELILAGEGGIEKYKTPSGKIGYTPDGPTFMRLPVGTEITNNKDTMKELAEAGVSNIGGSRGTEEDINGALLYRLTSMENTFKNKKEVHINFSKRGAEVILKQAAENIKILNDFFS